jgi:diguanylate cyclase (GGDEF)-like protein
VRQSRRFQLPFHNALILAVLIFLGDLLGGLFLPPGRLRVVLADLSTIVVDLLALACLILATRVSWRVSRRLGWVWGVVSMTIGCLTAGDIAWAILEVGFHQNPLHSIINILYFATYPLFLIGGFLISDHRPSASVIVKRWLDIGIIILSASLISWNYLLGPLAASGVHNSWIDQAVTLAYPIGDLLILWSLIMLLYRHAARDNPRPLVILFVTAGVLVVTHIFFTYQSLTGGYASGTVMDLGWPAASLLAGLAGVLQYNTAGEPPKTPRLVLNRSEARTRYSSLLTFFPYLWILLAYLMLVGNYQAGFPMPFTVVSLWVGSLIGLVVIRQVIVIYENHHLNDELNLAVIRMRQQTVQLQAEISERERAEERLLHDATHDSLTGLPNRVLFYDRLERAIAYFQNRPEYPFAVLFLDVDQFKVINDSLGHNFGDEILSTIANRLKSCLRTGDTVARLGGDEFVILLEGSQGLETILAAALRILDEIRIPVSNNDHQVYITASIGIVPSIAGYRQPEDVLRDADIAMYRAKALGKNRYEIFNPNLRIQAISRLEIENDLRRALEMQEFTLYYQPIIVLETGQITGFETLIRWRHPTRGIVSPAEFIPIAEETGLIIGLGQWVLEQACAQVKIWQELFPELQPLHISVNISGKQFVLPDFTQRIEEALTSSGVSATTLMLEITETVFINNAPQASMVFNQLCELGVQLQIDDFGTGYSSLSYLQHFPIHTIKIDQSFIQGMGVSFKNSELVHTILDMAHDLGMEAIAEGIETDAQLEELRRSGCKFGQGYLLSRPMDRETAEKWLAQKGCAQKPHSPAGNPSISG